MTDRCRARNSTPSRASRVTPPKVRVLFVFHRAQELCSVFLCEKTMKDNVCVWWEGRQYVEGYPGTCIASGKYARRDYWRPREEKMMDEQKLHISTPASYNLSSSNLLLDSVKYFQAGREVVTRSRSGSPRVSNQDIRVYTKEQNRVANIWVWNITKICRNNVV